MRNLSFIFSILLSVVLSSSALAVDWMHLCADGLKWMGMRQAAQSEQPMPVPALTKQTVFSAFDRSDWVDTVRQMKSKDQGRIQFVAMEKAQGWARELVRAIGKSKATAEEKVAFYRLGAQEIEARTHLLAAAVRMYSQVPSHSALISWKMKEIDVGGGVTLFVGAYGHAVEIQPDGSVYRVNIPLKLGEFPMNFDWVPPYKNGVRDESRMKAGGVVKRIQ